jgi:hypothetical protein
MATSICAGPLNNSKPINLPKKSILCDNCLRYLCEHKKVKLNDIPGKTILEQILYAQKCASCAYD